MLPVTTATTRTTTTANPATPAPATRTYYHSCFGNTRALAAALPQVFSANPTRKPPAVSFKQLYPWCVNVYDAMRQNWTIDDSQLTPVDLDTWAPPLLAEFRTTKPKYCLLFGPQEAPLTIVRNSIQGALRLLFNIEALRCSCWDTVYSAWWKYHTALPRSLVMDSRTTLRPGVRPVFNTYNRWQRTLTFAHEELLSPFDYEPDWGSALQYRLPLALPVDAGEKYHPVLHSRAVANSDYGFDYGDGYVHLPIGLMQKLQAQKQIHEYTSCSPEQVAMLHVWKRLPFATAKRTLTYASTAPTYTLRRGLARRPT